MTTQVQQDLQHLGEQGRGVGQSCIHRRVPHPTQPPDAPSSSLPSSRTTRGGTGP